MTGAAASLLPGAAALPSAPKWRERLTEFLLIGGITLVLLPLALGLRLGVGLDRSELAVGFVLFHAAFVLNDPHFAVTYLLFYDRVAKRAFGKEFTPLQRVRYWVAGFVIPLGLTGWILAALALRSGAALGWLIQLMFLLVGWHYTKQAFGVLSVLCARRGVRFSPVERRGILFHCYAAWAYAWASPMDPGRLVEEKGVIYMTLAHPRGLELATLVLFILSNGVLVFILLKKRLTEGRLPPVAPLGGFLITVWLWTVFSTLDPLLVYAIPALHSLQYLYFVWLLKRNQAREAEGPPKFGRPVALRLTLLAASAVGLGWVLFRGLPQLLDSVVFPPGSTSLEPDGLGPTPFVAALFCFVNIHHYFMDTVIWRRDNPDTRFLRAPHSPAPTAQGDLTTKRPRHPLPA